MNCKEIEERLIDYIDGELSNEENKLIEEHLKDCTNCQNEYEELKSTIDYVMSNSNSIKSTKDIKLDTNIKRKKAVKRLTRTGLIAMALSLIFVVTAMATDLFGLRELWKNHSEITENAWEELISNGVGQKLDISTIDQNIKITAEGVISDELNTIILLKIEDLKGNNQYTPARDYTGHMEAPAIALDGDISNNDLWGDNIGMNSDMEPIFSQLYSEDKNILKLMIWTNPLDKEKGNIHIQIDNMQVMTTTPLPYINENEKIWGNWNLTIPVEVVESKVYQVDKKMDMDGQEVDIKQIVIAPTATSIKYGLKPNNEENDYYIDNISFLIESENVLYGKSDLSLNLTSLYPVSEYMEDQYKIQSLYLKDPKEIELQINSYNASTIGNQSYTIDYDNLPQTLDYKNNKITIENIELDEDSTRIIIKEDDSKDRRYIKSDISTELRTNEETIIDGIKQNIDIVSYFSARKLDYETRDEKGKTSKEELSENHYHYVFKQELIVDKQAREPMIRPETINIVALHYKEFPNSKINIKLK